MNLGVEGSSRRIGVAPRVPHVMIGVCPCCPGTGVGVRTNPYPITRGEASSGSNLDFPIPSAAAAADDAFRNMSSET